MYQWCLSCQVTVWQWYPTVWSFKTHQIPVESQPWTNPSTEHRSYILNIVTEMSIICPEKTVCLHFTKWQRFGTGLVIFLNAIPTKKAFCLCQCGDYFFLIALQWTVCLVKQTHQGKPWLTHTYAVLHVFYCILQTLFPQKFEQQFCTRKKTVICKIYLFCRPVSMYIML